MYSLKIIVKIHSRVVFSMYNLKYQEQKIIHIPVMWWFFVLEIPYLLFSKVYNFNFSTNFLKLRMFLFCKEFSLIISDK